MEKEHALKILNALAQGVDPASGERFPADSPYQHPDTVRALFEAVHVLEAGRVPAEQPGTERKPVSTSAPGGPGSRWTPEEEQRLAAAFDSGKTIGELARLHGRSTAGIEARLLKLGKIDASALTAPLRYPPKTGGHQTQQKRREYRAA